MLITLVTAAAMLFAAMVAPRPAVAEDLATMRSKAQAVADTVTDLEKKLASLRHEQASLTRRIDGTSALIGRYELRRHRAEAVLTKAEDAYRRAAVAQYESPDGSTMVALMLSSTSMSELYTLNEAASASGKLTKHRLRRLLAVRATLNRAETEIDHRKQILLGAKARAGELTRDAATTLADRKRTLARMMDDLHGLERQARAEARRRSPAAASPTSALRQVLGSPGGLAPMARASSDIPKGYLSTGVSFQGEASWYGPGFEGRSTASGQIFHGNLLTAASKDLPLGTRLLVGYQGRGVVVLVNDRGPYAGSRVLDLSAAAAQAIGISGVGWVTAEIVIKA